METITLNLIPTGVRPTCHVSQNDNERNIKINLVEGSLAYSIRSGDEITLNLKKPDNHIVIAPITATIGNTYVIVEITDDMCNVDGENICELRITNGSTRISTSNFNMVVEASPDNDFEGYTFASLEDVSFTNLQNGQIPKYNSETEKWENSSSGGVSNLSDLDDVSISSASDGQVLKYNSTRERWENKDETLPVNTASGAIANFDTDLSLPLVECKFNIVATGGNGTPDNPNPINGYSSANITRCGVNLLPETYVRRSGYSTPTATTNNGVITITNYDADGRFVAYNVKVKVGGTYTIKYTNSSNITNIGFLFSDNEPTAWLGFGIVITQNTATTITATKEWLQIYIEASADNATVTNLQIELGSTATAYHAYNGQTYAIAFGQTVYGGVPDVTRGKLHVTHGVYVFTGNESITPISSQRFRITISDYAPEISRSITASGVPDSKMEVLSIVAKNQLQNYENAYGLSNEGLSTMSLFIRIGASTTTEEVVTAITGRKMTYPLATPFDIDLTPVQINALMGVNNVYNDTNGDTEVKYKEGIQHYIDKKIAATQALIL